MSSGHGGARAGAGRPRNNEKYAEQIASFHDRAAADIDKRYQALAFLADGGFEEVETIKRPAGLITINKVVETKEGAIRVTELAFPHLDPEQLVIVEQKTRIAAPDRQTNQYLVDRVAGKPTQATELSGPGGQAVPVSILDAAARIYGDAEDEQ